MSQIKIHGEKHFVLSGWDAMLGRFFVDIYNDKSDDFPAYESDADKAFVAKEATSVYAKLKEFEVEIPPGYLDLLLEHHQKNASMVIVNFRRDDAGGWFDDRKET